MGAGEEIRATWSSPWRSASVRMQAATSVDELRHQPNCGPLSAGPGPQGVGLRRRTLTFLVNEPAPAASTACMVRGLVLAAPQSRQEGRITRLDGFAGPQRDRKGRALLSADQRRAPRPCC